MILLHSLTSLDPSPVHTLIGHSLNVSTLQYSAKRQKLISGSWDRTARIWSRSRSQSKSDDIEQQEGDEEASGGWECELVMEEHEEAVWGVLAVDDGPSEGCWLTSSGMSADPNYLPKKDGEAVLMTSRPIDLLMEWRWTTVETVQRFSRTS